MQAGGAVILEEDGCKQAGVIIHCKIKYLMRSTVELAGWTICRREAQ
jgi:hypothetical protein